MQIGVSYKEALHMTPHAIRLCFEAYNNHRKDELQKADFIAHLQGMYILEALYASVGNMFSKGKKMEYPKKPYGISFDDNQQTQNAVDEFFAEQDAMRRKWKNMKSRNGN